MTPNQVRPGVIFLVPQRRYVEEKQTGIIFTGSTLSVLIVV